MANTNRSKPSGKQAGDGRWQRSRGCRVVVRGRGGEEERFLRDEEERQTGEGQREGGRRSTSRWSGRRFLNEEKDHHRRACEKTKSHCRRERCTTSAIEAQLRRRTPPSELIVQAKRTFTEAFQGRRRCPKRQFYSSGTTTSAKSTACGNRIHSDLNFQRHFSAN